MSTASKGATPLVTNPRFLNGGAFLFIFMVLFMAAGITLTIMDTTRMGTPTLMEVLLLLPAGLFLIATIIVGTIQSKKGVAAIRANSENVSSYLREHYGILVHPSDCAVYCENPTDSAMKTVIPAEDLNTGNNIRVTLKFSDNFTAVTPFVVNSAPLKSRVLA